MQFLKVLLLVFTAMVTQSCKITMPSLVSLITKEYDPYDFQGSKAIQAQQGFQDTLIIGDDPTPGGHGERVLRIILGTFNRNKGGIPEKNIMFFQDFGHYAFSSNQGLMQFVSDRQRVLRNATKVVHIPYLTPLTEQDDVTRVAASSCLFVLSASNMRDYFNSNRNLYNSNHPVWQGAGGRGLNKRHYQNVLDVYNTGKVIAATSAKVTEAGEIEPFDFVVPCGDIKESCFTLAPEQATSASSARLAAMSFYLAQFWETPEEVIDVLSDCSVDVGEPGVDREYGRGLANLLCPRVLQKEVAVVQEHLGDSEEEEIFSSAGGDLAGSWEAEKTPLQIYIPAALKETLQAEYQGTVTGTVTFQGNTLKADFTAEADIAVTFLMPIEAKAEDTLQFEEAYMVEEENTVSVESVKTSFTYEATEDSLHLIRSYTLNEMLSLLPDPLGSMAEKLSEDLLVDNRLQVKMRFARVEQPVALLGDFDGDGTVGIPDFLLFTNAFGSVRGDRSFDEIFDLIPDGIINVADFLLFIDQFGKTRNG